MKISLFTVALTAVITATALLFSGGPEGQAALPPAPVQPFNSSYDIDLSNSELGMTPTLNIGTNTPDGERQTLPAVFYPPGWQVAADKEIATDTNTGGLTSQIDLFCDNVNDQFADSSAAANPAPFLKKTTDVNPDPAQGDDPEDFVFFDGPPFPFLGRSRADANTVWLGGTAAFVLSTTVPINSVAASVPWSPGLTLNQTFLGGNPSPPSVQLLCLDSPQNATATSVGSFTNPAKEGDSGTDAASSDMAVVSWSSPACTISAGACTVTFTERKANYGVSGDFHAVWDAEVRSGSAVTLSWAAPAGGPPSPSSVVGTGTAKTEFDLIALSGSATYTAGLTITCNAATGIQLVTVKNWEYPINSTIDQYAENNVRLSVVKVDCGGASGNPADKQVIRVYSNLVTSQGAGALNTSIEGTHIQLDDASSTDAIVEIDALLNYLCKSSAGGLNDPCNEPTVTGTQTLEFEATPGLVVAWHADPATTDCGVFPAGCPTVATQSVSGATVTTTIAEPAGKQTDLKKKLRIHCDPAGGTSLETVVVKAVDEAVGYNEQVPVDNASAVVIKAFCNDTTTNGDGIDDAVGFYPISTALQSAADVRKPFDPTNATRSPRDTGYVERIVDVECFYLIAADNPVNRLPNNWANWAEPAGADDDQDCLEDAATAQPSHPVDPNDNDSDSDNDGLLDGTEAANGSSVTEADADNDGCSDFCELFQGTNPGDPDTDDDGIADRPEDDYKSAPFGSNETSGFDGSGSAEPVNADDNCPADFNPTQTNSDSASIPTDTGLDATNPDGDHEGDACDSDDDNDGLADVVEPNLLIDAAAPPDSTTSIPDRCDSLFDEPAGAGVLTPTNPLVRDSDAPGGSGTVRFLDGAECQFGGDPTLAGTGISGTAAANEGDARFERFVRTQGLNVPAGDPEGDGVEDDHEQDPDNDSFQAGTADTNSDAVDAAPDFNDNDEVKRHGTSPVNVDTDGDGCADKKEIASINLDNAVNNSDLLGVALHPTANYHVSFDINKDGLGNNSDLLAVALQLDNAGNPKCAGSGANGTGLN
jgi:hypothetical protein